MIRKRRGRPVLITAWGVTVLLSVAVMLGGQPQNVALTQGGLAQVLPGTPGPQHNAIPPPGADLAHHRPDHKIEVFIVGVPSWQVSEYEHDIVLGGDIQDTCLALKNFFVDKFGSQVEFHPQNPCTAAATTRSAIRKQLEFEMPRTGSGTLTFLFMMSHGESVSLNNPFFSRDTEFITSDATDSDKAEQSISIGVDLMSWLKRMPYGSTVLAFVDTCNAGAVQTPAVLLQGAEENSFAGLTFGLMVASISHESTYATAFTESLVNLWKSGTCPAGKIEEYLYGQINKAVGGTLKGYDGRPEIVVPYAGGWCLSDLGRQGRLLFLYQGSTRHVMWNITSLDDPKRPVLSVFTDTDAFDFAVLQPGRYKLVAEKQEEGALQTLYTDPSVDLVSNATFGEWLENPTTPQQAEVAWNTWADGAKVKGLPQANVTRLEKAASLVSQYLAKGSGATMGYSEFAGLLRGAGSDPDKLRSLGERLVQTGNFKDAAQVLAKAAKTTSDNPRTESTVATDAFLAAGIAGDTKTAQTLSKKYDLNLGSKTTVIVGAVTAARTDSSPASIDRLKTISAMTLAAMKARVAYRAAH